MYLSAIVLAAGRGLRFSRLNSATARGGIPARISKMAKPGKSKIPKTLVKIDSRPVIIYCLDILSKHPSIRDIIVVVNAGFLGEMVSKIRQYRIDKVRRVVRGGRRRQDSVYNALRVMDNRTDLVLIHDGVRPFIDKETVSSVIKEAQDSGAAVMGVPVKATVKQVRRSLGHKVRSNFIVRKTLKRDELWEVQTPQVFSKRLILEAYKNFGKEEVTDDASLVEKLGAKVSVILGSYNNIKITTPEDLVIAKAIAKKLIDKRNAYCRCPTE